MKKVYSEDEIDGMAQQLEITIADQGWLCEDGHWLTMEEFKAWTDEEIIEAFALVYPMFIR